MASEQTQEEVRPADEGADIGMKGSEHAAAVADEAEAVSRPGTADAAPDAGRGESDDVTDPAAPAAERGDADEPREEDTAALGGDSATTDPLAALPDDAADSEAEVDSNDKPAAEALEKPCGDPDESNPAKRLQDDEPDKGPAAARSRPSTSRGVVTDDGASDNASAADEEAAADAGDGPGGEPVVEKPRVQVYGSTVSGNRTYKKQSKELFMMLEACEVDFEFVCIAADEQAKKYVRRKALGNMAIPQIYVDGELKGFYDDAFKANECDELYEWLGLDEDPVDY
ncbi:hypothetical protein LPJ61_003902 [Coemansia biformis]|uniref:Glutaredoxin domain-containing protein n=1 Tax=Coemansia biformis TaxID=1286918 RepID=A0A9W7YCZ1_9FUNG|nr:hypothetical protein LPJ61_003902 [Coemansia biformis]